MDRDGIINVLGIRDDIYVGREFIILDTDGLIDIIGLGNGIRLGLGKYSFKIISVELFTFLHRVFSNNNNCVLGISEQIYNSYP